MCGIAGAIDLKGRREFPAARLLAMTGAIAHRGPDDEQIHLEPGLAMGARRLSIVDLAGGRQPIGNEDGTIWVTQNGEIFEYPELQAELVARGHRLATRCDTELWVHLYEDLGEEMFRKARGQFAVALWDRKARTLILGRDRVGICPLYYTVVDGWLLWGSEIKALLVLGDGRRAAGPEGHRPVLPHVLRRDDAHVLRGDPLDPARAVPAGPRRPGRAEDLLGPRLPRRGPGAPAGRSDAADRRARSPDAAGRSRSGCGATCRWSATSAAGWIRRSCWASARASGATPCRRSRSAWTAPARTSGRTPPSRPRRWARG